MLAEALTSSSTYRPKVIKGINHCCDIHSEPRGGEELRHDAHSNCCFPLPSLPLMSTALKLRRMTAWPPQLDYQLKNTHVTPLGTCAHDVNILITATLACATNEAGC